MTTETPSASSDAPAPATTTPSNDADVRAQLAELQSRLDGVTEAVATVAKLTEAVEKLTQRPNVPATDGGVRPTVTPTTPDFSTLPPIARMASGYK